MAIWKDQVFSNPDRGNIDENLWGEMVLEYPNLIEAFTGIVDEDKRWKMGPSTLMLFVEGGKLKFCLSPKYTASICFGVVPDPTRAFDSIESELQKGHYEWKPRSTKK